MTTRKISSSVSGCRVPVLFAFAREPKLTSSSSLLLPSGPASPTSKKSKHIPAHLQSQWDLDRSKKADFKRARAEARLESLLDPFTSGSKNSRSNDRKGKKKGKNVFSPDDPDSDQEMTSRAKGGGITDMVALDREIQGFLRDHGKTTMSLPPMEKESRKRVHLVSFDESFFLARSKRN